MSSDYLLQLSFIMHKSYVPVVSDMSFLYSSESVSEGHPDKICDQVSDAIVDAVIAQDPKARIAVETAVKTGVVWVFGELTTSATIDVEDIVRNKLREIGYTNAEYGISDECGVLISLSKQSPDIAQGVNKSSDHEQGAGDQGMMYGYASHETDQFMPAPILLSHALLKKRREVKSKLLYLRPDAKAQVTIEYSDHGVPTRCHTVVLSTQHDADVSQETIRTDLLEHVIKPVLGKYFDEHTIVHINPTGRFVIGGPQGDSGLTGRKIIVDAYGGVGRHGGGAFSGKDPSKVDRSGAYAARYIAKHLVAAGICERCEVQLAYAIGVADPVSVYVDDFGTSTLSKEQLEALVRTHFPLKPADIIRELHLLQPQYARTAVFGHFGREDVSWEALDRLETLKNALSQRQ